MDEEYEIVFFCQNKLGGVTNFYYNIICHAPDSRNIKWILCDEENDSDSKPVKPFDVPHVIFKNDRNESVYESSARLEKLVSNKPGAVVTNFPNELAMLHLYRKSNKTVYFICHDETYLKAAKEFDFLIDVYIAHNPYFAETLKKLLPNRSADIHFLTYGITPRKIVRKVNVSNPLRLLFLARLHKKKGVYDLLLIDEHLQKNNVPATWTVIGNGPEHHELAEKIRENTRFTLHTDFTDDQVTAALSQQDVFVLPSSLDGVPVAMLEAMSAGIVPVIYSFNPGIRSLFKNEAFIFDIGDVQGIATGIARLHNDRKLLEEYSMKCEEIILKNFEVRENTKKYFELFRNYRLYKKKIRFRVPRYNGLLSHPLVPDFLRTIIRQAKQLFQNHNVIQR